MQSQQQTKGEVIAELRGKTDSFSIKDISSSGVKMENNDIGQITGKYQANFMETISIHMKPDGTSEWEGKGVQMAGQDMVVTTSKGHGHQTGPGTIAFFFQAEDGIQYLTVTGVQTCALPIYSLRASRRSSGHSSRVRRPSTYSRRSRYSASTSAPSRSASIPSSRLSLEWAKSAPPVRYSTHDTPSSDRAIRIGPRGEGKIR